MHTDFFTKIDSEPDQAGIEFGKNMRSMGVGAEEVGKWVGGMGVCVCVCSTMEDRRP